MVTDITMQTMMPGGMESDDNIHVVMFYGPTCGPCKATMPHYEQVAQECTERGDKIRFHRIDAWNPPEQKEYCTNVWGIRGVPQFKVFSEGREILSRSGGGDYDAINQFIQEALFEGNFSFYYIRAKRLVEGARLPEKAHEGDLGYDVFSAEKITIPAGQMRLVSTGAAVQFPRNYGGLVRDRSSMAMRMLYTVAGVIDNGYVGELKIAFHNASPDHQTIQVGDKIAQVVLMPTTHFHVQEVDQVFSTDQRGENGFGSTGS